MPLRIEDVQPPGASYFGTLLGRAGGDPALANSLRGNPYYDTTTNSYRTFSDLQRGTDWTSRVIADYNAARANLPNLFGRAPAPTTTTSNSDGFRALNLFRYPSLPGLQEAILNYSSALPRTQTRDIGTSAGLRGISGALAAAIPRTNALTAAAVERGERGIGQLESRANDFLARFAEVAPRIAGQTAQQTQRIADFYSPGGVAAELARTRGAATSAENLQAQRAARQAVLASNVANRISGVTPAVDANLANVAARIGEEAAVRSADRARDDQRYVLSAQERLLGRPQDLESRALEAYRTPYLTESDLLGRILSFAGESSALPIRNIANLIGALGSTEQLNQATDPISQLMRQIQAGGAVANLAGAGFHTGVAKEGADYPLFIGDYRPGQYTIPLPVAEAPYIYSGGGGGGGLPQFQPEPISSAPSLEQQIAMALSRQGLNRADASRLSDYFENPENYAGGFELSPDTGYFRQLFYNQGGSPALAGEYERAFG